MKKGISKETWTEIDLNVKSATLKVKLKKSLAHLEIQAKLKIVKMKKLLRVDGKSDTEDSG